ncbi:MAG: hypothetical protein EOO75_03200, partial [Myxococcales bacterium]
MDDSLHVSPVPAWASFFTSEQYGVFVTLVEADLRQRGLVVSPGDGVVNARQPDGRVHCFGLQNLAQLCQHRPVAEWPAM